jgi:hypothetical protein
VDAGTMAQELVSAVKAGTLQKSSAVQKLQEQDSLLRLCMYRERRFHIPNQQPYAARKCMHCFPFPFHYSSVTGYGGLSRWLIRLPSVCLLEAPKLRCLTIVATIVLSELPRCLFRMQSWAVDQAGADNGLFSSRCCSQVITLDHS